MLVTSGTGGRGTCPVCGANHASCGQPGTGSPVDIAGRRERTVAQVPVRRWVNYNGKWRIMRLAESDPRFAGSVEYDDSADDGGRPAAELSAADVEQGRTVEDVRAEREQLEQQAEQRREAARRNADNAGGTMRNRADGSDSAAVNDDGVLENSPEEYGDDVSNKARTTTRRSGGTTRRTASTSSTATDDSK